MKNKNCPNCGAPIDFERNKCAYCGTSYYDLSAMPLNEPFFLRINVGTQDKPKEIFARVICHEMNLTQTMDSGAYPETNIEINLRALCGFSYQEC